MATLREVQLALQQKIEEVRQRDELIDELEEELMKKDKTLDTLKMQLTRYRALVKRLSVLKSQQKQPNFKANQASPQNSAPLQEQLHHLQQPLQHLQQPIQHLQQQIQHLQQPIQHLQQPLQQQQPFLQSPKKAKSFETDYNKNMLVANTGHFSIATSSPVKIVEPSSIRNKLVKLHSVNESGKTTTTQDNNKLDNNNSPSLTSAAKKRLSFCTDKAKIIGTSDSPLFNRFKKF